MIMFALYSIDTRDYASAECTSRTRTRSMTFLDKIITTTYHGNIHITIISMGSYNNLELVRYKKMCCYIIL